MAKQKGVIKVKGTLDEVTFYERNGKSFARKRTTLNGTKIKNSPKFVRTRENMNEFGASALVGKALRIALGIVLGVFADGLFISRLVKVIRTVIQKGAGVRGKRGFVLMDNKNLLNGFEMNLKKTLESAMRAPYSIAINAARNAVTMTVLDFDTEAFISAPSGASHFRFVCAIGSLSNYSFNADTNNYEATDPSLDKLGGVARSTEISFGGMAPFTILTPQLPGSPTLTPTVGLVVCIGIEFLQFTNGTYYLLAKQNAMRIVEVF